MTLPVPAAIVLERARQLQIEGWTAEHDDQYLDSQLYGAARCYAARWRYGQNGVSPGQAMKEVCLDGCTQPGPGCPVREVPLYWPWDPSWWKPRNCLADLKRAGALMLAEIARRERAGLPWQIAREQLNEICEYGRLRGVW